MPYDVIGPADVKLVGGNSGPVIVKRFKEFKEMLVLREQSLLPNKLVRPGSGIERVVVHV